jgi:ornithine carbamoyltransferase
MAFNLHGRNFLKEIDFTQAELRYLLRLTEALKLAKSAWGTAGSTWAAPCSRWAP